VQSNWRPNEEFQQWEWDAIQREVRVFTARFRFRFFDREDLESERGETQPVLLKKSRD
jgi:hypothetical protein